MTEFRLRAASRSYHGRAGHSRALVSVDLVIARGERVAVLGPSGAGKSTLIALLNTTLRATGGTVTIDGVDPATLSGRALRQVRRRIGTIFQVPSLVPSLSAIDNVLCGRLPHWSLGRTLASLVRPPRAELTLAEQALADVGLAGFAAARADELSGGQQQRVAIARALAQAPDAILADEPFAAVDPTLKLRLAELLCDVAGGKTLVTALHDVELALAYFPRVVGVSGGRIVFDLPVADVTRERLAALYGTEHGRGSPPR